MLQAKTPLHGNRENAGESGNLLGEGHFGTLKNPGKMARAEGVETLTNWFEAENEVAA
jgi:hypothetical protein